MIILGMIMMTILFYCNSFAQAETEKPEDDYAYSVINKQAKIIYYKGEGGIITIPNTLGGFPVTSIGRYAFNGIKALTILTIPPGVTEIEPEAFDGFEGLTEINLPEGINTISPNAFQDCKALTSVNIPQSVTSIEKGAFRGCLRLTNINIPSTVVKIGEYSFYNCLSLKNVTIPEKVTEIGEYTFYNCKSFTSNNIPKGVASIGNYSFSGCTSLMSITLSEGITKIGKYSFEGCTYLTNITIPQGVSIINEGTFNGCKGMTGITLPLSVTSIDKLAFSDCEKLKSINIPEGVTSISESAFKNCNSLISITFNSAKTVISSVKDTIPPSTKIIGYDPSLAKAYAAEYNHKFEILSVPADVPITADKVTAPKVVLDGTQLTFDVPPIIENGRTLVPLRAIFEAMGAEVKWDPQTATVTAVKGNTTVVMKIGSLEPTINGVVKPIDVAGKIVNDRTLAPLRFVCEAFGGAVEWAKDTQTATIKSAP